MLLSLAGSTTSVPIPAANCGLHMGSNLNTSNLCKASQVGSGGTITSVSDVVFSQAGGGPITGLAYLVNLAVTGAGQKLSGTYGQVQQALVASTGQNYTVANPSAPFSISYGLVNESYYIPYYETGAYIDGWRTVVHTFSFTPPYAGYGHTNCVGGYDSSTNFYSMNCTGGVLGGTLPIVFYDNMTAAGSACAAQTGGILAVENPSANQGWFNNYVNYSFQCITPFGVPIVGGVYEPVGTKYLYANVSITYTNATGPYTTYLTNFNFQDTFDGGKLYAQMYGYTPTGTDILGSSLPVMLERVTPVRLFLNFTPVSQSNYAAAFASSYTGAQQFLPAITGGSFTTPVSGVNKDVPNVYYMSNINTGINTTNSYIESFLKHVPSSSFYYGQTINASFANFGGILVPLCSPSGQDQCTYNPKLGGIPYEPDMQLIGRVSSLDITLPSPGVPQITQVEPSPFDVKSGSTAQVIVYVKNVGQTAGNFYVAVSCGGNYAGGQGDQQQINGSSTQPFELSINTPVESSNVTLTCTATASGLSPGSQTSSITFSENVAQQCPAEPYPVNPTTCQAVIPPKPTCSGNQTAQYFSGNNTWSCIGPSGGTTQPQIPWYVYVIAAFALVIVIFLALLLSRGRGRQATYVYRR